MQYTTEQLTEILRLHKLWLVRDPAGKRADLSDANLSGADLSGANLSDANLSDADLSGANLSDANLSDADLSGADLSGANLSDANLSDADLRGADLSGANLSDADLSGADLRGADLSGANLSDANLSGANLRGANLSDANLSDADQLPAIEPMPGIVAAVASAVERDGCKLDMNTWHTCETTHCMAGWITTLHPQGKLLESIYGCGTAAALILNASRSPIPDFYDTGYGANDRAMNWLKTGQQVDTPTPTNGDPHV